MNFPQNFVDGPVHSRHRKVMNPAFSAPQLRSFLPLFQRSAIKASEVKDHGEALLSFPQLCRLLKEEAFQGKSDQGQLIAINKWLSRVTLDIIGECTYQ